MASSSSDIDEVEHAWGGLQIAEEEEQGVFFNAESSEQEVVDARWCLVGKLLGNRVVDFDSLRNVLDALWRPVKGLYVKKLEINRYLFQFFHEIDINRVLEGTPWTFKRVPIILERLKEGDNPRLVPLNTMEIWVQVYNLRAGFMSDRVLKACGDFIGKFVSSCPKNYTRIWCEYLRVRVLINIEKPLKRRMKIFYSKMDFFWVDFKYERVPTFCFICGIIGHWEKFCGRLYDAREEDLAKPYGLFMKAPDNRRPNKQIGARWLRDSMGRPLVGKDAGVPPPTAAPGVRFSGLDQGDSNNQGSDLGKIGVDSGLTKGNMRQPQIRKESGEGGESAQSKEGDIYGEKSDERIMECDMGNAATFNTRVSSLDIE